jgi:hypothetical protein
MRHVCEDVAFIAIEPGQIKRGGSELDIRKTGESFDESWDTLTFNSYGSRLSNTPQAIIMSM